MAWTIPVIGGKETSGYGSRKAPTAGASTNHAGIDYAVPVGTAVMAAAPGAILNKGWDKTRGYFVEVDHGGGTTTFYQHLKTITSKVGDYVTAGQKIALSGDSGLSTGPHLHFEVRQGGKAIDPAGWGGSSGISSALANMTGIDTGGIMDLLKQYWLYITVGLVVMAVIRK